MWISACVWSLPRGRGESDRSDKCESRLSLQSFSGYAHFPGSSVPEWEWLMEKKMDQGRRGQGKGVRPVVFVLAACGGSAAAGEVNLCLCSLLLDSG